MILQNISPKTKSGRASSYCTTYYICRVAVVLNPVISYERWKDRFVITTIIIDVYIFLSYLSTEIESENVHHIFVLYVY